MPLMMLDLDNTLVDRDDAFRRAVAAFLAEHALPESDLDWVMFVDASGYTPRQVIAESLTDRYRLPEHAVRPLLDGGGAELVVLPDATRDALERAVASGWTCVIVTNGPTDQQTAKIRNTGLDRIVHGWVISEAVGCKKPDPEIFKAAAATAGASLDGAWVIGDSPGSDIAGAQSIGARSGWVSGGRPWPQETFWPTVISPTTPEALLQAIKERL